MPSLGFDEIATCSKGSQRMTEIKSIAEAKKVIEERRSKHFDQLAKADEQDDQKALLIAGACIEESKCALDLWEALEKSVREKIMELEEAHNSAPQEYWDEYDSRIKQLKEVLLGEDKK